MAKIETIKRPIRRQRRLCLGPGRYLRRRNRRGEGSCGKGPDRVP